MSIERGAAPETSRRLFWAVLASTAGVFIASSVLHLLHPGRGGVALTDASLVSVLGLEAGMALCWLPPLKRRGWRLDRVTAPATIGDVPLGIGLAIWIYVVYWAFFMAVATALPELARAASQTRVGGSVSRWMVLIVSVVNPIGEEFLYLGFVANVLRSQGVVLAASASVLVRVLVHVYQGPLGVLANIPVGGVLAAYYLSSGRLWPAVIAHGAMDLVGLWPLTH